MVTRSWAGGYSGGNNRRSGVTRGVAHSALVTSDDRIKVGEMREHGWDVELEDGIQ